MKITRNALRLPQNSHLHPTYPSIISSLQNSYLFCFSFSLKFITFIKFLNLRLIPI